MRLKVTLIGTLISMATIGNAQSASEKLGECLVLSTSGADRVALARWVGFALLSHPSLSSSVAVLESSVDESNREMAEIVTRLLTISCLSESRNAIFQEGDIAFEMAFQTLGAVAMEEIMRDDNVAQAFEEYSIYVDDSAFDAVFD